ncbi:MAG: sulfatase [Ilumatobacteraceae bacterium]
MSEHGVTAGPTASSRLPDHVVVVLLDSLNRHLLGSYGSHEFDTPNLDRFGAEAVVFDRHHTGSLPCMPARHDILVGALDFPWRPWGSIEIWEDAITRSLRAAGVTTMLVSDHPHLFETGGENYHTDFTAWEYLRGHENDPWRTVPDPTWVGAPAIEVLPPRVHFNYTDSRTWFRSEEDFPGPRTMQAATDWIVRNDGRHERSLLFVDEFDPHEPFDTPEPWASRYHRDGDPRMIWPPYVVGGREKGVVDDASARALRSAYGAKLSMIDHWFGRLLDAIDGSSHAANTAVIVCTDHGHYLGERDVWGKPGHPIHDPLGHIPLMIRWPGVLPRRESALTTSVDIHATMCDIFGVIPEHRTHGRSLVDLVRGNTTSVRDHVLTGYWGREMQLITKDHCYIRGSVGSPFPLSMWSNRWSTMPVHAVPNMRLPRPDGRARLDRMPGSDVPVIRQPFVEGDLLPFWAYGGLLNDDILYERSDVSQERNLAGRAEHRATESRLRGEMKDALTEISAPDDLFERLGL